jgi:K+-transporting ATPase ATPase C chain
MPNNATASSGSNLGPLNPAQIDAVKGRIDALKAADPGNTAPIPVDLVTASASGLDPEISLAAARYQVGRIARARNISVEQVQALISKYALPRRFGFFGEPRVNDFQLNLALD